MKGIYKTIYEIRHRIEKIQAFVDQRFKVMLQSVIDLLNKLVFQLEEKEKKWESLEKSGNKENT